MSFQRYAALIEYDGSAYLGWQRQPFLSATIQEQIEVALSRVADESIEVICAGRTDAGVHAIGQIAHFDTSAKRSDYAWLTGANRYLPYDIRIRALQAVRSDFHARYDALRRHYRYIILNSPQASALWRMRSQWHSYPLQAESMHSAAQVLLGEHDFSSFRAAECQSATPYRFLESISVIRQHHWVIVDIVGNAFLHHMIRNIVGSLLMVGDGRRQETWIKTVLECKDRRKAGPTASASGLYFYGVKYPESDNIPIAQHNEFPL